MSLQISDADNCGLIKGAVNYSRWDSLLTAEQLNEEMWLYAYESTLRQFNKSKKGDAFIKKHEFFGPIYSKGISFYEIEKNQPELKSTMKALKHENLVNKKFLDSFDEEFAWDADEFDEVDFSDISDEY